MKKNFPLLALANSTDNLGVVIALSNELSLDNEGWALLAPFGEHYKTRLTRQADGSVISETFVQIVEPSDVDTILTNDNDGGFFSRLKRAFVKQPIYNGHPDLKQYSPSTVRPDDEKLVPIGLNDGLRKSARGLEFKPLLVPEGADVVQRDGCKWPSALFLLKKTGVIRPDGAIECRPYKVASIGLTTNPNISGVDSLANANPNNPAAKQTETENKNNIMKQLLIGWLAANGVVLANDASDQLVFEKFLAEQSTRAASLTALGNDKSNLAGSVASLTGDKSKLVAGATLPTDLVTAANTILSLGNSQNDATGMKKKFIEARVDLAINQGKAPVADRATEITALENSKALETDLENLQKRPVKFAINSQLDGGRQVADTVTAAQARDQILVLANSDPKYKDMPMDKALEAIKRDKPELYGQMAAKPAEKTTATTT